MENQISIRIKRAATVFAVIFALTIALFAAESALILNTAKGYISFKEYVIYANGVSYPKPDEQHKPNIKISLQRKAEKNAREKILYTLSKIPVNSEYLISDVMTKNKHITSDILRIINEYKLESVSYPNYGVKTEISLPLLGEKGVVDLLYRTVKFRKIFPTIKHYEAETEFSALIVDARNIGLKPSIFPSIYDEKGNQIYGVELVEAEYVHKYGIVQYINEAKQVKNNDFLKKRMGKNPYRVVAWRKRGINDCDIVISDEDGRIILSNNKLIKMLKECKVVVIIN